MLISLIQRGVIVNYFNGLDSSLLVKHLVIKDGTRVPSSRRLVKQYNKELSISLISHYQHKL